jgi:hypothetical protein
VGDVIEMIRFRLRDETSVEEFVESNAKYQADFAYQQTGLRRRTVASGLDGEWLSITLWSSKGDANRARDEARDSTVANMFEALIEQSTKSTEYFKELPG